MTKIENETNETTRDALSSTEFSASINEVSENDTNETNETTVEEFTEECFDEKDKAKESRYWFMTFNGYTEENIQPFISILQHECVWYVFQEEKGKISGLMHLQGTFYFKSKKRLTQLKKWNKKPNWKITKSVSSAIAYCSKEDTRAGRQWVMGIDVPEPLDIEEPYGWQLDVIKIIKEKPDKRTIHWFWEPNGNMGKTTLCKYLVIKHSAIILSGKSNDMFHLISKSHNKKIIVVNVPRISKDYVNIGALESIKDGLICSGKYEGCQLVFNCPHVIVFANQPPNIESMSKDRWNIVRIDTVGTVVHHKLAEGSIIIKESDPLEDGVNST